MKHVMLLILTISLSGPLYADTTVNRAAAPSSDKSITDRKNAQEVYHDYDSTDSAYTTDTTQTGQSSTKREYQHDSKVKSCRSVEGTWLRPGEIGYSACMDNAQTMKK